MASRFPGCPELNALAVAPAMRSRGVGTAIVRAAEALACARGVDRMGLGVDDDNERAADRYSFLDARGVRHDVADPARFLVKDLWSTGMRRGSAPGELSDPPAMVRPWQP